MMMTGLDINPVSLQMAAGRMTVANPSVDMVLILFASMTRLHAHVDQ